MSGRERVNSVALNVKCKYRSEVKMILERCSNCHARFFFPQISPKKGGGENFLLVGWSVSWSISRSLIISYKGGKLHFQRSYQSSCTTTRVQ